MLRFSRTNGHQHRGVQPTPSSDLAGVAHVITDVTLPCRAPTDCNLLSTAPGDHAAALHQRWEPRVGGS